MRRAVAVCLMAGCQFTTHGASSGSGGPADAPRGDAAIPGDGSAAATCYGTFSQVCLAGAPTRVTLALDTPIDTDSDGRCEPSIAASCVMFAGAIAVTADVAVTGARPLVLLAATTLGVGSGGTLDASSHDTTRGAAANATSCTSPGVGTGGNGALGGTAGGGGAGGTFGAQGSVGGDGAGPTAGGTAPAPSAVTALRGGCPGGGGGAGGASSGGGGGASGGALYLLVGSGAMHVDGAVFASGAGGRGGGAEAGGGGGGAGGLIVLEASTIEIGSGAAIAANGGGGGGGGGSIETGADGAPGSTTFFDVSAGGGGPGDGDGGTGGRGAAGANATGDAGGSAALGPGGGGGGAAGVVWTKGALSSTVPFSPAPTQN